jgi:hypothetical protein
MPISEKSDPNQWPDRFLVILAHAMHRAELAENAGETPDYNILPPPPEADKRGDVDISINAMLHIAVLELVPGDEGDAYFRGKQKAVITKLAQQLMNGEFRGMDPTPDIPFAARDSAAPGRVASYSEPRAPKAPREPRAERPASDGPKAPRASALGGKTLHSLCAPGVNPRAAGSHGHKSFQIILDSPGIEHSAYLAAGGRQADLAYNVTKGFVEIRD